MDKSTRIYIAGHRGMVGSAIYRRLQSEGYTSLIARTHVELDLIDQTSVRSFFREERIDYIVMAAARVGGIHANDTYRADFIYENLMVEANVIHEAYRAGIERLLFLGSSCIYPQLAPQPMREEYLLTGLLEPTNEPYAIAKIAGIKLCESYNRQYGTRYRSVMPTNLYGPNDTYDLENSHLMAALIRKFHLAKLASQGDWDGIQKDESHYGPIPEDIMANLATVSTCTGHRVPTAYLPSQVHDSAKQSEFDRGDLLPTGAEPAVLLWGTGTPRREFLYVDDMADACIHIMTLSDEQYKGGLAAGLKPSSSVSDNPVSFFNIGTGSDHTIRELAEITARIVGFNGGIDFDSNKPDGMPRKLLDVTRLNRLDWKPRISLADGIQQTYEHYRSHKG